MKKYGVYSEVIGYTSYHDDYDLIAKIDNSADVNRTIEEISNKKKPRQRFVKCKKR